MQKLLTLLTVCLLPAASGLAQGRLFFVNSSAAPLRIYDPGINGGVPVILGTASTALFGIGPASVRVRLFAGLTSTSLQLVFVGTCSCLPYVTNSASAIVPAQGTFNGGPNLVLPFDGTQPVYLQYRVDSINEFFHGVSPMILVNLATDAAAATTVFSATPSSNQWGGLTISASPVLPWITSQPQSQTVGLGGGFTLSVGVDGMGPFTYQWRHFGTNNPGATNSSYSVVGVTTEDGGDYDVQISNPAGPLASAVATITIGIAVQFTLQPVSQVAPLFGSATFSALANGNPAPVYQWLFKDQPVFGATLTNLLIANIQTNVLGDYSVIASNGYSVATSSVAALYMSPSLRSPFSGTVAVWGREATLSVFAQGSGELSYQWFKDGVPVSGATSTALVFPSVQFTNGGLYHVVVTSAFGSVTNTPAQLVINPANVSLGFYAGITIDGVPGYTYGIEYSTNLSDLNAWTLITNVTLVQPVQLWIDTSVESHGPGNNGRHYRVTAP